MGLFDNDIAEQLLLSFNSSQKESLDEIALDQDEQDKILLNASKSVLPLDLRVDYSDFVNHIFFNSAYTSVNLAYSRIISDFPTDGTYREFFEWQRINNGYENWFFDNFPKQQGYVSLTSGSDGPSVFVRDYENKINFLTNSVTIEFILKPYENFNNSIVASVFDDASASQIICSLIKVGSEKYAKFSVRSGSAGELKISCSVDAYVSSSNHFAFIYNSSNAQLSTYVNGALIVSSSTATALGDLYVTQPIVKIGHLSSGSVNYFYSGSIDDFKLWTSNRSAFVAKNYTRPIFANPSGGLKLYYRFNEVAAYGNKIIDYSGNVLDGQFSGTYTLGNQRISGTLGAWFKDPGDPILDSANSRVVTFFTDQQNSGSAYDGTNRNYIFKFVPSFFVDSDDADYQKLFLLLVARHYDRLKLYIEHLSNIHNINLNSTNDTPDRLMNLVAANYGIDIGDIYDSSDPLQYYFGEEVLNSSGSLDSSIEQIKFRLKRNVLNNLIYLLKTKSTRHAIEGALSSLGVDTDVVNINQYSLFSGGIETIRQPKVSECRVLNFNSQSVANINPSAYIVSGSNTFQVRVLFNTASSVLTSSIFSIEEGNALIYGLRSERENSVSTSGTLKLAFLDSGSVLRTLSSSLTPLYNNEWVNIALTRTSGTSGATGEQGFYFSQLDYDHLINSQSVTTGSSHYSPHTVSVYLGTSGSNWFSGNMHEFRAWKNVRASSDLNLIKKWHFDYESLEVKDFNVNIPDLLVHYKLNDFTGSTSNSGTLHDFVAGLTSSYTGFTTSSLENFPGKFISRYVQSYSYDLNVNNNNIRIKNEGKKLTKSQQTIDIPFVTVDVSPVVSLNKEIIKFFGNLEKFNNIVGHPRNKYRDEIIELGQYRYNFFNERVNLKIDFKSYIGLIKWLDSNFTHLLSQLIPLDMISSISNYVIEPNVLEYNKISYGFPYQISKQATVITSSISVVPQIRASGVVSLDPADPGRFGAASSASAYIPSSYMSASQRISTSGSINDRNRAQRNILYLSMSSNKNNYRFSGTESTQFVYPSISSSNYLRDVLNVNTDFYISSSSKMYDLSSSAGPNFSRFWTGSLNAVQDQRWMWNGNLGGQYIDNTVWDFGIGYGGCWGQLWEQSKKSRTINANMSGNMYRLNTTTKYSSFFEPAVVFDEPIDRKIQILWPSLGIHLTGAVDYPYERDYFEVWYANGYTGSYGFAGQTAASFGPTINIDGFKSISIQAFGNLTPLDPLHTGVTDPSLKFEIKFQFFNESDEDGKFQIGDSGFEGLMSGSLEAKILTNPSAGSIFKSSFVENIYILTTVLGTFPEDPAIIINRSFSMNFSRPLPDYKFMRIYVTPILATSVDDFESGIHATIKGILSTKEYKNVDIYEQRSI